MACPICSGVMESSFKAEVLGKYLAQYEICNSCGFLRVNEPHWLDEAYSSAIAAADTGLVMRNISLACKVAGTLYWVTGDTGKGQYLDAAGGYGMLTRLMRDLGFNFFWSDKYCSNLLVPGFEYSKSRGRCTVVTAMEVLEHLTDPVSFIEEALSLSGAETLLFTTELYEGSPPKADDWWYYTFATGQHIGFFQRRTLETIGKKLDFNFASANGIHIFSKKVINEKLLALVTGRWTARVAPWWIRRRLGSRTITDHEQMMRKIG